MRLLFLTISMLLFSISFASAADTSPIRDHLTANLVLMRSVFDAGYAPTTWKKSFSGWDLDTELEKALAATNNTPDLTLKDARNILKSFIYSTKDYHVSISFELTEKASLPLTIKGANDKYFIAYIDRSKLPVDSFPFQVGDELVSFADQPVADVIAGIQSEVPGNVEATDRALAELRLTVRGASRGYRVPQGPVTLGFRRGGSNEISEIQLIWDYTPEKISEPGFLSTPSVKFQSLRTRLLESSARSSLNSTNLTNLNLTNLNLMMKVDIPVENTGNPHEIGGRKTFTPDLGVKIWETPDSDPFHAYIFKAPDRRLIGYVRIPSYDPEDTDKAVEAFSKIIRTFEVATDALVIDQVNNPGGSVFYLYALASMLSQQPLYTPQHRVSIMQADVAEALQGLKEMASVKDDETAKQALGNTLSGYPVSYEVVQFIVNYYHFVLNEWSAGRKLSRPNWLWGVDKINPNPVHYTKPILLLTNALDFSGGDFFPAIMQDNKRVTILGTRTAGAGGYVLEVKYPNSLGIRGFRFTGSIAKRIDENPIENLGVQPDLEYELTETDLTNNYSDYVSAIQAAVNSMTK